MTNQFSPDLEIILKRLEKVESQNRIFKMAGLGVIILLLGFIVYTLIPVSQIKAERFIICDKQGKQYGWLGVEKDMPKVFFVNNYCSMSLDMVTLRFKTSDSDISITPIGLLAQNLKEQRSVMLSFGYEDKSPSLYLSGEEANIHLDGKRFGISLDTKDVLGINEPYGLTLTKWKKELKIGEKYWRLPIGSLE